MLTYKYGSFVLDSDRDPVPILNELNAGDWYLLGTVPFEERRQVGPAAFGSSAFQLVQRTRYLVRKSNARVNTFKVDQGGFIRTTSDPDLKAEFVVPLDAGDEIDKKIEEVRNNFPIAGKNLTE